MGNCVGTVSVGSFVGDVGAIVGATDGSVKEEEKKGCETGVWSLEEMGGTYFDRDPY